MQVQGSRYVALVYEASLCEQREACLEVVSHPLAAVLSSTCPMSMGDALTPRGHG